MAEERRQDGWILMFKCGLMVEQFDDVDGEELLEIIMNHASFDDSFDGAWLFEEADEATDSKASLGDSVA
ncbi:Hypothetical protein NTJ_13258 [Nesidiocoris tenuis]|uniref:Uncharacterized protein n=1 Tax=Nesidiocoris tenuis TaxID=355587 RepID=A0ABN7BB80_9HEMI|nr:Hypothetical protein NTJ_13258 [Nesidiocoris tenuis]